MYDLHALLVKLGVLVNMLSQFLLPLQYSTKRFARCSVRSVVFLLSFAILTGCVAGPDEDSNASDGAQPQPSSQAEQSSSLAAVSSELNVVQSSSVIQVNTSASNSSVAQTSSAPQVASDAIERGKVAYVEQCLDCHGAKGEGGFGGPVNGDCKFTNCQDLTVLTEYIETDMPWKGGERCTDQGEQTCATDVALYMHDQIVAFVDFTQDNDNDGLIDSNDACPNTAADAIKSIDSKGCAQINPLSEGGSVIAVNVGGPEYVAADGTQFDADFGGTGGSTGGGQDVKAIGSTEDDTLYSTERYAADGMRFQYRLAVPNGAYQAILHFVEVVHDEAGKRIFDVQIEGQTLLEDIDPAAQAGGGLTALTLTSPAFDVTDGTADFDFVSKTFNAQVSAIQLVSLSSNDGDDDGVADEQDACPGSSPSQSINASGCTLAQLDTDNDGLTDDLDTLCPNTAPDDSVDSAGEFAGCSSEQKIADTDSDGVKDLQDRCEGSSAGEEVDAFGCTLLGTLGMPESFSGRRFVNGIQFSWRAYASPVDYWIIQRWDDKLSQWQTLAKVEGDVTSYQARETSATGHFQLYSVTDDVASFPAQFFAGRHDVTIASRNYGGKADNGFFEYTEITGDFDARVVIDIPDAGTLWRWERSGLMARESLEPGSRHIGVWVPAGIAPTGTKRTKTDEESENYIGDKFGTISFPKEIRLVRKDNTFTWSEFRDNAWRKIHSDDFALPAKLFVGLPAGSKQRITISYDGFQVNGQFMQSLEAAKFGVVNQADVLNYSDVPFDDSIASLRPSINTSRFVHITRNEYQNFVQSIFPGETFNFDLSSDDSTSGYAVGSNISQISVERYQVAAQVLAEQMAAKLIANSACDFDESVACLRDFIKDYGQQFFRRPLRQTQIDDFITIYSDVTGRFGKEDGVKAIIEGLAQSPQFLYKFELMPDEMDAGVTVPVTGYEMATRLAAALWSSTPDEALLSAAKQGRLVTPAQVKSQAERMVKDSKARQGFKQFYSQWLSLNGISKVAKDSTAFPGYNQDVATTLEEAAHSFVEHVVFSDDVTPTLENLLTAPLVATSSALDFITGTGQTQNDQIEVIDSPKGRSGLLGQPGLLSMLAHDRYTSIVLRGVYINERILCEHFPQPPAGIPDIESIADVDAASKTARERLDELTSPANCDGCHRLINPVGGILEGFDAIGRQRDSDNGLLVDTFASILTTDDGEEQEAEGLVELNNLLASMKRVKACVADQYLNYAAGRIPGASEKKSVDALLSSLLDSNGDLRQMMVDMTQTDMFLYKKRP